MKIIITSFALLYATSTASADSSSCSDLSYAYPDVPAVDHDGYRDTFIRQKYNSECVDSTGLQFEYGTIEGVYPSIATPGEGCSNFCIKGYGRAEARGCNQFPPTKNLVGFEYDCEQATCKCLYQTGTLGNQYSKCFDDMNTSNQGNAFSSGSSEMVYTLPSQGQTCYARMYDGPSSLLTKLVSASPEAGGGLQAACDPAYLGAGCQSGFYCEPIIGSPNQKGQCIPGGGLQASCDPDTGFGCQAGFDCERIIGSPVQNGQCIPAPAPAPLGSGICTLSPDFNCYIDGHPPCCNENGGQNCPDYLTMCNNHAQGMTGFNYCSSAPSYQCYDTPTGHPACCNEPGGAYMNCPKTQPGCDNGAVQFVKYLRTNRK
jgi:hypothetical protein